MSHSPERGKHLTILLAGGRIEPAGWKEINAIAEKYDLTYYLTTAQNLRLLGITEQKLEQIKKELLNLGLKLKAPGKFPLPKVCVGKPYCNLGVEDPNALSDKLIARFGDRTEVKPKYKIAISGCPASCSGSMLADIGIVATRRGFDLYVGGKGGPMPKTGKKIGKGMSEEEVIDAVGRLIDYHAANTTKKQRMYKLLDKEDFPL